MLVPVWVQMRPALVLRTQGQHCRHCPPPTPQLEDKDKDGEWEGKRVVEVAAAVPPPGLLHSCREWGLGWQRFVPLQWRASASPQRQPPLRMLVSL